MLRLARARVKIIKKNKKEMNEYEREIESLKFAARLPYHEHEHHFLCATTYFVSQTHERVSRVY